MTASRRICVVTATRAEYGLLYWLMKELQARDGVMLQLAVTGAHLAPQFGSTYQNIKADGFAIDAKVAMPLSEDTTVAITKATGQALIGFADAFAHLQPDALVILGDRYELIAAATAALLARIPILHIGGGDATEGAVDEQIRHALTKMAHLHFVATAESRRRVIQMGEHPDRVFLVGGTGIDNIKRLPLLERDALSARIGFDLSGDFLLATYHPVTLGEYAPTHGLEALLSVLSEHPTLKVLFTGVNADPGYQAVDSRLRAFAAANPNTVHLAASLGQLNYLSAMRHCRAVIGNSSSGIIEAPSLQVPTINLGDRQKGRVRAASVIDCDETEASLRAALDQALSPAFQALAQKVVNPYGDGGASARIADIIATTPLSRATAKAFWDLPQ